MALYPLAPSYFGVEHVAILEHLSLGTALSIPGLAQQPALVDVSLLPDPTTGGWRVRSDFGFLGALDGEESSGYQALNRLRTAAMTPTTQATVEIVDGEVEVAVALGLDPWMIPANNQPAGTALLSGGDGVLVRVAEGELTAHQVREMGTEQLIVTLALLDGTVLATHDNLVLGPCAELSDSPALAAAFAAATQSGASLAARAYAAGGRIAVDLPLAPADPVELFAPAVPPLPLDSDKPAIPPALDPDADWEFTTPADPLASPLPTGSRAFTSPKGTF
ncbi:hypothetical protein WU87_06940 [Corynebacterium minutissimum]|uniref:Uncharacterized protein n=1 Tax=Corynebacterium minutissimum TaxID=38301 RepID=A0ACC4UAK5_9CORY|nr:hypothetical protein WU87_06940 [Corynebacterium minutissimum]